MRSIGPVAMHPFDEIIPFEVFDEEISKLSALLDTLGVEIPDDADITTQTYASFAALYYSVFADERPSMTRADEIEKGTALAGLGALAAKINRAAQTVGFDQIRPHLAKMVEGSLLMNGRNEVTDDAGNKNSGLYVGCLALGAGCEIELEDPNKSGGGTNPDVLLRYAGQDWSIAVKTSHSATPQTIFGNGFCRKLFFAETWGYDRWKRVWRNSTMIEFKGSHFEREVILWGVRWYVAYPISYRQLEEMMEERGVEVDHSTLNRWVVKYAPLLDQQFRARKRSVGSSWRLDETCVKVKGSWKYLYRAVDKAGATVDFLLTAKRDRNAALRFLRKAIGHHGVPKKITIDKSGANTAAIESYNAEHGADIQIRRIKYLSNIVEQDHRAVKPVVRPMMGFKSFRSAAATLAGVELMHMIRKGQLCAKGTLRPAQQFYALAG